jgi:hypothetical protein
MTTDNQGNTGFVLALAGGGAALLWLLWRGRGTRNARDQVRDHSDDRPDVVVWICSGDRVKVDGVNLDLATAVDRARRARTANVFATGDARHGWVEQARDAMRAAGVDVRWHP